MTDNERPIPEHLVELTERKERLQQALTDAIAAVGAARLEMAAAEYEWSAHCLSLAGLHRYGPDTRRRRTS